MLYKINNSSNTSNNNTELAKYFNNTGLLDIAQYSQNKYTTLPDDKSLTRFYKLGIDNNYNIVPVLE